MNKETLYTFTEQDFNGSGQYLIRGKKGKELEVFKNGGRLSTFMYKVGYIMEKGNNNYALMSMSDGWILPKGSKSALVKYLNDNPYNDKYRFATKEEVIMVIESQNNRVKTKL